MSKSNSEITFLGNKVNIAGEELREGALLPKFRLSGNDLQDLESSKYQGKVLILSVVPSLDTPVCAVQTRTFNEEATKLSSDVVVLTVSVDLPFAQKRWCGAEGISRVETASDYKYREFGEAFGVSIPDIGLLARAVFVADKTGRIVHVEYVSEITQEPNYQDAIAAAKKSL